MVGSVSNLGYWYFGVKSMLQVFWLKFGYVENYIKLVKISKKIHIMVLIYLLGVKKILVWIWANFG